MNVEEIAMEGARVSKLQMGPERWQAEYALTAEKTACAEYRSAEQTLTFVEWFKELVEISKQKGVEWGSDEIRADYYENQPDVWLPYYDDGCTPADAIDSDMECWDA